MEKQNKLHKLWPAHIGEFYNPEHNEIKKNRIIVSANTTVSLVENKKKIVSD